MTNTENQTPAGADGTHEFTMNYSEKEVPVVVEKNNDVLTVHIDDQLHAELKIQNDGSVMQTSGPELPDSNIEFIKKEVLGQDK